MHTVYYTVGLSASDTMSLNDRLEEMAKQIRTITSSSQVEEYIYGVDGIVGEQRGATPCFIFMTPTQWSTQNDPHPLRNVNPPKKYLNICLALSFFWPVNS